MQPLIIIGCHRLGTGLVGKLLSRLGIFMGHDVSKITSESNFRSISLCFALRAQVPCILFPFVMFSEIP